MYRVNVPSFNVYYGGVVLKRNLEVEILVITRSYQNLRRNFKRSNKEF